MLDAAGMSKARLVITAVVVEGRSVSEAAASYGVSRSWAYELIARYRVEGDRALEPRSRRPKNSPRRISDETIEMILVQRRRLLDAGLDAGAHTIAWHLEHHHHIKVSPATVWRRLRAAGVIDQQPKKRPKSSYIRFQADQPNETWQSDMTHWRIADSTDVEILTFLDDHARYALSVTAHDRVTTPIVVAEFTRTAETHGIPASVLTDNGLIYTTRFAGVGGGRNRFETLLADLGVTHKHSAPNHPTTCGKVERFQQTLKRHLATLDPPTRSPRSRTNSTPSPRSTTRHDHTDPSTASPPPSRTNGSPKPNPDRSPATPANASAATESTPAASSPSATTADSTTSASDEPTPEPTSCSSSTTATSASSTPAPANYSEHSPSTPPGTTNPSAPQKPRSPNPEGPGVRDVSRHHIGGADGN